jgi:hypothetical protein
MAQRSVRKETVRVSGFVKRFLLSIVASKLHRMSYRRGHSPVVNGLLREVNYRLHRKHHRGYRGHYGHYGYHGHYRRKRW